MSGSQESYAVWLVLASAAIIAALGLYLARRRDTSGAQSLALLAAVMVVICLATAGELTTTAPATQRRWFLVRDAVAYPGAILALWFALQYAGLERWLTRRVVVVLVGSAVVRSALYLVDDSRLLWSRLWWDGMIRGEAAPVGVAFVALGWVVFLAATVVLALLFVRSPAHRLPVALILVSQVVVRVVYALEMLDVIGHPNVGVVVAFDFAAVMYSLALFRFRLFNLVPAARDTIIERLPDPMMALDRHGRIADLNRAAERLLGDARSRLLGRPIDTTLAPFPELARAIALNAPTVTDVHVGRGDRASTYEVYITSLADWQGVAIGRLVHLHDIGELRRAEERLVVHERELAAARERELMARELHDRLGQVLGYVGLQADAARKLLIDGDVAESDRQLSRLADAARSAHADVRAYILELQAVPSAEVAFLATIHGYLDFIRMRAGVATDMTSAPTFDEGALRPETKTSVLRIVQQALANAATHGRATRVRFSLDVDPAGWRIEVEDDGVGFDPASPAVTSEGHFGLRFMRLRAADLGGSLEVESAPGRGTRVILRMPTVAGETAAAAGAITSEPPANVDHAHAPVANAGHAQPSVGATAILR